MRLCFGQKVSGNDHLYLDAPSILHLACRSVDPIVKPPKASPFTFPAWKKLNERWSGNRREVWWTIEDITQLSTTANSLTATGHTRGIVAKGGRNSLSGLGLVTTGSQRYTHATPTRSGWRWGKRLLGLGLGERGEASGRCGGLEAAGVSATT